MMETSFSLPVVEQQPIERVIHNDCECRHTEADSETGKTNHQIVDCWTGKSQAETKASQLSLQSNCKWLGFFPTSDQSTA